MSERPAERGPSGTGHDTEGSRRREKARPEMLALLDSLCRDSLEMPLASAQAHPDHGEIHAAFARLAWLIEEVVHA